MVKLGIITWHKVFPVDTGHAIRVMSIAKMLNTNFDVKIISITHKNEINFEYTGRVDGIMIKQMNLSNLFPQWLYNLSCIWDSTPIFLPIGFAKIIKKELSHCKVIQIESLRFYRMFKRDERFKILDEHNVEFERVDYSKNSLKGILRYLWRMTFKLLEINAINNADLLLVTSKRDMNLLKRQKKMKQNNTIVIPNCIDTTCYNIKELNENEIDKTKKRAKIVFVGSLSYYPNTIAVEIILKKIAPKIPNSDFYIIGGGYLNNKIEQPQNVFFTGYVENLEQFMNAADIFICPLQHGSGTRLKILEFLVYKKPIISTLKGVEGLGLTHAKDVIIEDDFSKYPIHIKKMLENTKYRNLLVNAGKKLVEEKYDWRNYSKPLCDNINNLMEIN